MFKFQITKNKYGITFVGNSTQIVFGNKNLNLNNIVQYFPALEIGRILQKHTTIITKDNILNQVSDGHQWSKKHFTVPILTADCLPLIAINHNQSVITNLHCGRVGLTSGILNEFLKNSNPSDGYSFFIGPHIETYEIGPALYEELKSQNTTQLTDNNGKYYFSLAGYVKEYIEEHFNSYKIYECNVNTLLDEMYWSHRGDHGTLNRNLNFAFFEDE